MKVYKIQLAQELTRTDHNSEENPHETVKKRMQSQKVSVYGGVVISSVLFFFENAAGDAVTINTIF